MPTVWLEGSYKELLLDWQNDGRHEQLARAAQLRGELSNLGRLYRIRLAWFPNDPIAERGRDRVVRLATMAPLSDAYPSSGPTISRSIRVSVGIALLAMISLLGILLARLLSTLAK